MLSWTKFCGSCCICFAFSKWNKLLSFDRQLLGFEYHSWLTSHMVSTSWAFEPLQNPWSKWAAKTILSSSTSKATNRGWATLIHMFSGWGSECSSPARLWRPICHHQLWLDKTYNTIQAPLPNKTTWLFLTRQAIKSPLYVFGTSWAEEKLEIKSKVIKLIIGRPIKSKVRYFKDMFFRL